LRLIKALDVLKQSVDTTKKALPSHGDIALTAESGILTLDCQIRTHRTLVAIPCDGDLPETRVPYKTFTKLVKTPKRSRGESIEISQHRVKTAGEDDDRLASAEGLRLAIGTRRFTLDRSEEEAFDVIVTPKGNGAAHLAVPSPQLRSAIEYIKPAICTDETRFHLNCAAWADGLLIATDGHRLHFAKTAEFEKNGTKYQPLSRPAVLDTILAAIKACDPAYMMARYFESPMLEYHLDGTLMDVRIMERCVESQFPPYDQVVPKSGITVTMDDATALCEAAKLAAKLLGDGEDGAKVAFNHELAISTGLYAEELALSAGLDDDQIVTLGVAPKYLADAVPNEGYIEIQFNSALDPLLISYGTHPFADHAAVIMPVRLDK
jgi:DNA polymerase III sliding clamp (beta) subunit (PCNA family)